MKEVADYQHKDIDEIWDYHVNPYLPVYVAEFFKLWKIYLCGVCNNPTLEETRYNSEETEPHGAPIVKHTLLYPFMELGSDSIPKRVAGAFEAALKVRQIDGAICAIAIRRTLEMMCKDKGEEGKNLYTMLKSLSDKGVLPPIINEMASVLRELGNAAAHADEDEFNQDLVPSMIEFTRIILDYVYNLPRQIEQIQDSIGKRTGNAISRSSKIIQENDELLKEPKGQILS